MNIDEKIKHIQDVTMTRARQEGNDTVNRYRQNLEDLFRKHQEETDAQCEQRIKSETTAAKFRLNAAMSKGALKLRRELSGVQREVKRELFSDVRDRIDEFMKTDEYIDLLDEYIIKAAHYAQGKDILIYLGRSDADKKEILERRTGLSLMVSEEEFIGGIRAVIPEHNMLVDYSFQNAIEREYEDYTFGGMRNA